MVIFVSFFILRRKFQVVDVITNISFFKSYSPGIKYILRSAQRSSENVLQRVIAFQTLSKRFRKIMHGIAAAIGQNIWEDCVPNFSVKYFWQFLLLSQVSGVRYIWEWTVSLWFLIGYHVTLLQIDELPSLVSDLVRGKVTWSEVEGKFGLFEGQETGSK